MKMTDCRFWGGYLLGIVTVLTLDLFDSFSHTWRIGALVVAALTGFGLLLARSRQVQHNIGPNRLDPKEPATPSSHPHQPLASDTTADGASPENLSGAAIPSPVPSEPTLPSPSFSPVSDAPAHEPPSSADDHTSPESASGPEPSPPATTAPPSDALELVTPGPDDLIGVWQQYWQTGDGHFNASGFGSELTASGFTAKVVEGAEVGAGDHVLIIDPQSADQQFYVLPSFATSPRSVQQWFDDQSSGALTATTRRVITVALGRWTDSRTGEVVKKGAVS